MPHPAALLGYWAIELSVWNNRNITLDWVSLFMENDISRRWNNNKITYMQHFLESSSDIDYALKRKKKWILELETENAETLTVKQSAPQPSAGADPPDYSKFDIVKATQYGNFMKMEYPNITRV